MSCCFITVKILREHRELHCSAALHCQHAATSQFGNSLSSILVKKVIKSIKICVSSTSALASSFLLLLLLDQDTGLELENWEETSIMHSAPKQSPVLFQNENSALPNSVWGKGGVSQSPHKLMSFFFWSCCLIVRHDNPVAFIPSELVDRSRNNHLKNNHYMCLPPFLSPASLLRLRLPLGATEVLD